MGEGGQGGERARGGGARGRGRRGGGARGGPTSGRPRGAPYFITSLDPLLYHQLGLLIVSQAWAPYSIPPLGPL